MAVTLLNTEKIALLKISLFDQKKHHQCFQKTKTPMGLHFLSKFLQFEVEKKITYQSFKRKPI